MLPARNRLTRSEDIRQTIARGRRLPSAIVHIYAAPRAAGLPSRVACIAGKKVHPRAVRRHQYQRWLRACASAFLPRLKAPHDIVLVAQAGITALSGSDELYDKIEPQLSSLMQ